MSTMGMPSRPIAAASSRDAPTVIPCSRAVCPACWITGPSARGSENGMPISSAAMPEVASFFPTSSDFFLFGWPAIMYPTSFRSPCARSAASSRAVSVFTGALRFDRVHVLVAAPREADEDAAAGTELPGDHARLVQRVRRLERRHDAFEPGAELERGDRVLVPDRDVVHALEITQEGVLGTYPGIVEPGRDRVRVEDLAVAVLQEVRVRAMKHARAPGHQRGRVLPAPDPRAGGLDPDQGNVLVVEERREHADGVGAASDARDHNVWELPVHRQVLIAGLIADHTLQVADHLRVRVRAHDRPDDVMGGAHVRHPVANRLGGRVLQRLGPARDLPDLGPQQLHAPDVHRLPAHVLRAHVDRTLEAEASGHSGDGDAVLPGAGLRDEARLAHADRQQRLPDRVVEFVRAGVAQILALEVDVRAAEVGAQARRGIQRRRAADEGMAVAGKLELELGVGLGLMPDAFELVQRAHQRFRHVLAAIGAEAASDWVFDHLPTPWGGRAQRGWGRVLIKRGSQ